MVVLIGFGYKRCYPVIWDVLLRDTDVHIYDIIEDVDGKQERILNKKETSLAQQKRQAIKDAFRDWVWRNPRQREDWVRTYDKLFNSTCPYEYDDSRIVFGGINPDIMCNCYSVVI